MNLKVKIYKDFGDFILDVDFSSEEKNIALLGQSGCGKSLTLKCIAGIIKPDRGYIELNGNVLFDSENHINLPPQKRKVGYLFQNYALFPNMTVRKNILAGIHYLKDKEQKTSIFNAYVKLLKIEDILENYPHQISGGQAQRVALARILVSNPDILLLDEPFSALDGFLRNKLQMEMKKTMESFSNQTVLVTHDRDEAYMLSKETVLVDSGKVVEFGLTKQLFDTPKTLKTALLTGCKNFSRAKKINEKEIELVDYGFSIALDKEVDDDISYVGIRAHCFSKEKKDIEKNIQIVDITEAPFEKTIQFRFLNQVDESENVYWKVERNLDISLDMNKVYFSTEDIMLLK